MKLPSSAIRAVKDTARSIIVGTPEDAIEKIRALVELSGGFGTLLCFAHEWAPTDKVMKSYELLMRYVAPAFQGQVGRQVRRAEDFLASHRSFGSGPRLLVVLIVFVVRGVLL